MRAKDNIIYDDEGVLQGGPISFSAFSFTIHPAVELSTVGGRARLGMDDGFFAEPRKIVIQVFRKFAKRIREETGGQLVPMKFK
jgi:hypothetical protein